MYLQINMGKQMKIKIVLLVLLIFLSFSVLAEEEPNEILDLSSLIGLGENVSGSGLDYSIEETSQRKDATLTFNDEDAFLDINGNRFENIQPNSEEVTSMIKLDETGDILEADFMTNENGGI